MMMMIMNPFRMDKQSGPPIHSCQNVGGKVHLLPNDIQALMRILGNNSNALSLIRRCRGWSIIPSHPILHFALHCIPLFLSRKGFQRRMAVRWFVGSHDPGIIFYEPACSSTWSNDALILAAIHPCMQVPKFLLLQDIALSLSGSTHVVSALP